MVDSLTVATIELARSAPAARLRALRVSPVLTLVALVAASTALRTVAAFERETPRYFPDEFIYAQLARSLAAGDGATVLGASVGMPALLEPLASAWTWLPGDQELAYRLTQAQNALVMSIGSIAVFLLARKVGAGSGFALAAAAVALIAPGLLYSGYMTADALGYTLCLSAVWAGVRLLSTPGRGSELLFCSAAGLAAFARLQYAVLLPCALVAALAVERWSPSRALRRFPILAGVSVAGVASAAAVASAGRYNAVAGFRPSFEPVAWIASSGFLLAVAGGVALAPGAVAGALAQLRHPSSREGLAFSALAATLVAFLLGASAVMAVETGSDRFFERYLLIATPLGAVAFGVWLGDGRRYQPVALGVATALALTAALVPLSGYAAEQGKADSPLLLALWQLEEHMGVGTASLAAALAVTVGAAIAAATALRMVRPGVAIGFTLGALTAISFGAHASDVALSARVRSAQLPTQKSWIDRAAGSSSVLAVQTAGSDPSRLRTQVVWNASIDAVVSLGDASTIEGGSRRLVVSRTGALALGERPVTGLVLFERDGSRAIPEPSRSSIVARGPAFELVRWKGDAQLAALFTGLRDNGQLAPRATVTVYPTARGTCRRLTLRVGLAAGSRPARLRIRTAGAARALRVRAGRATPITVYSGTRGPRQATLEALTPRLLFADAPPTTTARVEILGVTTDKETPAPCR